MATNLGPTERGMKLPEPQILQTLLQARPRLSAAVWLVVRDTHAAEDIFQNVTLKAMTGDATFDNEASLLSWAFITARREGIDWQRRHQRESIGLEPAVLELLDHDWQAPDVSQGARFDALAECLDKSPAPARQLLRLRYFEGRSCEEIAGQLGLGLDAVYKRLSRLHQSLRQCVEGRLSTSTGNPP
jgi:RNA polymerase sigma-70 factor (ECF subfamily)